MARAKVRQSVSFPDIQFKDEKLSRLMQFLRGQADEIKKLQSMVAGGSATQALIKTSTADYDATWADQTDGTITGAKNLGPGVGIFKDVEAGDLSFLSLIEGDNVTLTLSAEGITISSEGGGGGGSGTVTSVGIISDDLAITGSPVTGEGVIELEYLPHSVTYDTIQETTQDTILLGRGQFEGPGDLEEFQVSTVLDWLSFTPPTWGSVLFRGQTVWEVLGPGTEGAVLTAHGSGDVSWQDVVGVVMNDPIVLGTDNFASAGTASWADKTICLLIPAKRLTNLAQSFRLAWNQATGSLLTTAIVLRRAARGTTTFLDSTPVTFGASATPTFAPGVNVSDEIAIAIDDNHDYYVLVHFDATADPTAKVQDSTDAVTGFASGSLTGDHTTDADPSAFTLSDVIYGWIAAWVVKGNEGVMPPLPLTTKGDLLTYDGSTLVRFGVGADNLALVADSATATGLNWAIVGSGDTQSFFGSGAPVTLENDGDLYFDTTSTPYQGYVQNAGVWEQFGTGGGAPTLSAAILADSPVGFWKCNDASGSLLDSSGNGFHLSTVNGTVSYQASPLVPTAPTERFISVPSGNNGVQITSQLGLTYPLVNWSCEWIMYMPASGFAHRVFQIAPNSSNAVIAVGFVNSGGFNFFFGSPTWASIPWGYLRGPMHVMITCSSSGGTSVVTVYVNGVVVRTLSVSTWAAALTGTMVVGIGEITVGASTDPFYLGYLAFYNQVLTATRAVAHAQAAGLFGP